LQKINHKSSSPDFHSLINIFFLKIQDITAGVDPWKNRDQDESAGKGRYGSGGERPQHGKGAGILWHLFALKMSMRNKYVIYKEG